MCVVLYVEICKALFYNIKQIMTLKPFRKEGNSYYIGDCLIAVYDKRREILIYLSNSSINCSHSYVYISNDFENVDDFEKYFFRNGSYLFFAKVYEEYIAKDNDKRCYSGEDTYSHSSMFEATKEEQENYYLVQGIRIVCGKHNIVLSNLLPNEIEEIKIDKYSSLNVDNHYLLSGCQRNRVTVLRNAKKSLSEIKQGNFMYYISDKNIYKVHNSNKNLNVLTPCYAYPRTLKVTCKTIVKPCIELDNIYDLLDSEDATNVNLGQLLLATFYKQYKKLDIKQNK